MLSITMIPLTLLAEQFGLISLWKSRVVEPLLRFDKSVMIKRRQMEIHRQWSAYFDQGITASEPKHRNPTSRGKGKGERRLPAGMTGVRLNEERIKT